MTWAEKTSSEILADVQGLVTALERLPAPPDLGSIYVHPMQWALLRSYQLYWELRDQGVHWRRAKRMRRREWERLKRKARRTPPPSFGALGFEYEVQQQLVEYPVITDYFARH